VQNELWCRGTRVFTCNFLGNCVVWLAGCLCLLGKSNIHQMLRPMKCCKQLICAVMLVSLGVSVEQGSFVGSLWVAVILCLVRLAGIWGGCWLGCWLGATPVDHRKHMWYGMITQVSLLSCLIHVIRHC